MSLPRPFLVPRGVSKLCQVSCQLKLNPDATLCSLCWFHFAFVSGSCLHAVWTGAHKTKVASVCIHVPALAGCMTLEKLLKSSSFHFLSYEMVIKQLFLSYTYNIWMRTDTCYPSGIIVFLPHLLAFHRQCGLWSVSIYILCWISTPPDPKQLQACTLSCCWCIPLCPQAIARSVTLCLPD